MTEPTEGERKRAREWDGTRWTGTAGVVCIKPDDVERRCFMAGLTASRIKMTELERERDEFRKAFSRTAANSIMERGQSYQAGLNDAGYKVCESCEETCIPTCPICEEGKWEKASQAYFNEATELRAELRVAKTLLEGLASCQDHARGSNYEAELLDRTHTFLKEKDGETRNE